MKKWGFLRAPLGLVRWMRQDAATAWLFLAPSAAGFSMFYLIPFIMGVMYSFMSSASGGRFAGLANYRELLASDSFRKAAINTFYFSVVSVPLMLALSLGLALMLNRHIYFRKWLRTIYVLPLVVPVSSVIIIWQMIFDWNGALNYALSWFGMYRVDWMKSEAARDVVIVVYFGKTSDTTSSCSWRDFSKSRRIITKPRRLKELAAFVSFSGLHWSI